MDALKMISGRECTASEIARDIDWLKIRRVQFGISRPPPCHDAVSCGSPGCEERACAAATSRRAMRLANVLAALAGVLLGLAFLRGFSTEPALLAGAFLCTLAGLASATWSYSPHR